MIIVVGYQKRRMTLRTDYLLASLCYLSVFFAPFLLPLVVLILGHDEVQQHAKKALLSHLLPYLSLFFIIFSLILVHHIVFWMGFVILIFILLLGVTFIYNIVMGVRLLILSRR